MKTNKMHSLFWQVKHTSLARSVNHSALHSSRLFANQTSHTTLSRQQSTTCLQRSVQIRSSSCKIISCCCQPGTHEWSRNKRVPFARIDQGIEHPMFMCACRQCLWTNHGHKIVHYFKVITIQHVYVRQSNYPSKEDQKPLPDPPTSTYGSAEHGRTLTLLHHY